MTAFEMSAFGPVPMGTKHLTSPEEALQYVVPDPIRSVSIDEPARVVPSQPVAHRVQMPAVRQQPIKRGTLIQQVRTRIREIKAELKTHVALQNELQELERLLHAAKQKPKASVRPLRSVG